MIYRGPDSIPGDSFWVAVFLFLFFLLFDKKNERTRRCSDGKKNCIHFIVFCATTGRFC